MKNSINTRVRFQKPFHFLNNAKGKPSLMLRQVFQNFQPQDFRDELSLWQRAALSNDQSAYDEATAREDLIDMTGALQKLMECWHILYTKKFFKKNKPESKLERLQRKVLQQSRIVYSLTKEEQSHPGMLLHRFCKRFDRSYVEIELLDMLDAVITYEGAVKIYKGNLVLFYEHLLYLVRLSYKANKAKLQLSK